MTDNPEENGGEASARCFCGQLHGDNGHDYAADDEARAANLVPLDMAMLLRGVAALHAKYERPLTTQRVASEPEAAKLLARDEIENATRKLEVADGDE